MQEITVFPSVDKAANTAALQNATDSLAAVGGGILRLVAGVYLTAGLILKSNVKLLLERGAELRGTAELNDYPNGYLIYAACAQNVALLGEGMIDGAGDDFLGGAQPLAEKWRWRQGWGEVPAYYRTVHERPAGLICFKQCQNITVAGITLQNSPRWTLHLLGCENVIIQNMRIHNRMDQPNADGVDIDGSKNVLVENCNICTGDDAVVIKTTGFEGVQTPASDITVRGCTLRTTCNGLKIGTETQNCIRGIDFERCTIVSSPDAALCERAISAISLESVDGAVLDTVHVKDITAQNARCPLFIRLGKRGRGQQVPTAGTLQNITVENFEATGAILPVLLCGIPSAKIRNIVLQNFSAEFAGGCEQVSQTMPECEADYPEAVMFGRTPPAWGLCVRHAARIQLNNVALTVYKSDIRPKMWCEDAEITSERW